MPSLRSRRRQIEGEVFIGRMQDPGVLKLVEGYLGEYRVLVQAMSEDPTLRISDNYKSMNDLRKKIRDLGFPDPYLEQN